MAIFTDKIVTASFLDYPQNTLVEVIYKEGDQNTAYVMEVDFTQDDFKDLLQELTLDEIESKTKASVEIEKKIFTDAVEREIERRWALESEKIKLAYKEVEKYGEAEKQRTYVEIDNYLETEKEKAYKEAEKYVVSEKEKAYKEAEKYAEAEKEKAYVEIDNYLEAEKEKAYKEAEKFVGAEKEKAYKEAEKYLEAEKEKAYKEAEKFVGAEKEKAYSEIDNYLEGEKEKAYKQAEEYTKEEKAKFTKDLQARFSAIASPVKITPKNAIEYFNNVHNDKDAVFNMKIAVLEDPIIAKSKDKALKMKIRKAKSIYEILEVYSELKV